VIQRVVSCGTAVAREVFCCACGCLFFSALPRAVPLLCARVLFAIGSRIKGRSKARKQHPGAGFLFSCTKERTFSIIIRISVHAFILPGCIEIHFTSSISDGGNFKAKLALAAIAECAVGLEYLDLPAARFI
jgi:hypothetical protein